jgi:hypothetical protein
VPRAPCSAKASSVAPAQSETAAMHRRLGNRITPDKVQETKRGAQAPPREARVRMAALFREPTAGYLAASAFSASAFARV